MTQTSSSIAAVARLLAAIVLAASAWGSAGATSAATFTNPIVQASPDTGSADPSVVFHRGYYYYCRSLGARAIGVARARRLQDIGAAPMVTVFSPPADSPYGREVWAPELQRIRGRWYIYFAASDGINANHRMYALQAAGDDPQGRYAFKGRVGDESDRWAIDGVALELRGKLYFVWSGWPQAKGDFPQVLYIAAMRDPWTIAGPRHLLAAPEHTWERAVAPLLEGPEPLARRGRMHLVYSAGASWSDDYALGVLTYRGGDPLRSTSWVKQPQPAFAKSGDAQAFGVGHASFVRSPDGHEDWIVYHATDRPGAGWRGRSVRAQRFGWTGDDRPDFGRPVAIGVPIEAPSGTAGATVERPPRTPGATSGAAGSRQPCVRRNTSIRLLAGMSKRCSKLRPTCSAAATTSARRRTPHAGFRPRRSASKATLPGAVGSPSTTYGP